MGESVINELKEGVANCDLISLVLATVGLTSTRCLAHQQESVVRPTKPQTRAISNTPSRGSTNTVLFTSTAEPLPFPLVLAVSVARFVSLRAFGSRSSFRGLGHNSRRYHWSDAGNHLVKGRTPKIWEICGTMTRCAMNTIES